MKTVHLVIPDLFLQQELAAEICAGMRLPALEKLLARGHGEALPDASLESVLCGAFGVPCAGELPLASIAAAFDGLGEGCWLCADPVHLRLQGSQMLLLADMDVAADEAGELCTALNAYFAGQGMEFFAPHPQRWYVRLGSPPQIDTVPLSQAAGRNVSGLLPGGADAAHWHRLFNEMQMLLFAHPVNEAREARGALPLNSVWLWGGGHLAALPQGEYDRVVADGGQAEMFAAAAGVPFAPWPADWRAQDFGGRQLLVWGGLRAALRRGDLSGWRAALRGFEEHCAQPVWQALRSGRIARLRLDAGGLRGWRRISLTRADAWRFWRRGGRFAEYLRV
ncbi:MAG: hypothetical protein A2040_18085 [Rhodocyclales bacterium GWA2_65_19]|nr:MAG: hypothetical protein A2040_18085 [Rhodocyclales bacterium GWA2_65_19]